MNHDLENIRAIILFVLFDGCYQSFGLNFFTNKIASPSLRLKSPIPTSNKEIIKIDHVRKIPEKILYKPLS